MGSQSREANEKGSANHNSCRCLALQWGQEGGTVQQIHGPLMVGSSGEDVKIVQSILNRAFPAGQIATDGMFEVRTEAAVRAF